MTVRTAPAIPKLLIDTNVVLDAILERKPWVEDATALLDAIAKGRAEGHIAGHTVTTVYYIVERERNRSVAATAINDLLQLLNV
ncbi:MAG: type II toxin-antitoxin system VapC family toxin, partial [Gammaproteobacteria bacterium]